MNRRATWAGLVCAAVIASVLPVEGAFGRKAVADRDDVAPLRQADFLAALDGRSIDGSWRAAAAELPKKCQIPAAFDAKSCDDRLRCAWLSARASALSAFSGNGSLKARIDAVASLHRAADRLSGGGRCDETGTYAKDRRQAATDAAAAQLALLARSPRTGAPLLEGNKQRRLSALLLSARKSGVRRSDGAELRAMRLDMRTAWKRASWLAGQPVLSTLRDQTLRLWQPLGGKPRNCGDSLFRPELLDSQWRGLLVREAVPDLMKCLGEKLPRAMKRKGGVADESNAQAIARTLSRQAAADSSGLKFGKDKAVHGQVDRLVASLETKAPATSKPAAVAKAPAKTSTPTRSKSFKRTASVKKQAPTRAASKPQFTPAPTRSADSMTTSTLIELAERTSSLVGRDQSWVRRAQRARDARQRRRLHKEMLISAHRVVCAPLDEADPSDRDTMKRWLSSQGWMIDERACEGDGLERLLDASPSLQRLWAATSLRTSVRLIALDRHAEARRLLNRFPASVRGVSWAVVSAWAARKAGDSAAASAALERIDGAMLDRLRASGLEELARLMAHATVPVRR